MGAKELIAGNSMYLLLKSVFPHVELDLQRFGKAWENPKNQLEFTTGFAKNNNIKEPEDWYKFCLQVIFFSS